MACSSHDAARLRPLLLLAAIPLLALSACVTVAPIVPSPSATAGPSPTSGAAGSPTSYGRHATTGPVPRDPDSTATPLPLDTLVVLTGHATADNGATATVTAIVHAPRSLDDPGAGRVVKAMTASCLGEVDRSVLTEVRATLVTVDYRSTLLRGHWPIDLPLALGPDSTSAFVTAAGDPGVTQEQVLPAHPSATDYLPNCLRPAFMTIGASGSVYLAEYFDPINNIGLDNATFWGHLRYGFSSPYVLFNARRVTFDHCEEQLTALGSSKLGINPDFGIDTGSGDDPAVGDSCLVGGLTGH